MIPAQIAHVRATFERLAPHVDAVAVSLYTRLFAHDPSLRALFRSDLGQQGRKLFATLGLAVASLHRVEELKPALVDLGARHARYGVEPRHYAVVRTALEETLEAALGDAFTAEVRAAWMWAYDTLAGAMLAGNAASGAAVEVS